MIELEFAGAARTVTGSKHILRTSRATVLLDCGMFQGHRKQAAELNKTLPIDVAKLDAVVLSHAHIDHSGALPVLFQRGYRGPVYATPATRDLCVPMLEDSAGIQEADAEHIRRLIERDHVQMELVKPLYSQADVQGLIGLMTSVPYHRRQTVAPGIDVTFLDAGHVLGSAIVVLDIEDGDERKRLAFTGDLGRHHLPILRDPEVPEGVNCLLTESTYGDRLHGPISETSNALADAINRTFARGGKVVVPSFALERAQEIVYELKKLRAANRIPALPVYVDSPLTTKLTDIFKLHPDCYDAETFKLFSSGDSPFDFPGLEYVADVAKSKAIDASAQSCVIIASGGMCEGGRILHHLQATIENAKNTVLIVGYQAENTLGRRLVEQRTDVKIYGALHKRAAEVVVLNGFSAHADQAGLVEFAESVRAKGNLRQVILVHGEPLAQLAFSGILAKKGFQSVSMPEPGQKIRL